ncbi:MAG: thioredoxin family protein [Bacteroidales bacterium]|jgi:thiol:disulfide interchange protein DsbD|nr:thioredoxin family protein [Bacteroidales bacterium]MCI2134360.1 thioredoxin family protein [Bacteroidales bacterium]
MKHCISAITALLAASLLGAASFAQAPEATATWKVSSRNVANNEYEIIFSGAIVDGWHLYSVDNPNNPISLEFEDAPGYSIEGELYELTKPSMLNGEKVFFGSVQVAQKVKVDGGAVIKGELSWSGCNDKFCAAPEYWEFSVQIDVSSSGNTPRFAVDTISADEVAAHSTAISDPDVEDEGGQNSEGLWGLIIEAILWGFAMLLTPCVFPMIPMTVSFFMKQSSNPHEGRFKATMYGIFIVLLYTVPISIIIGLTWLIGGEAVTADIFNWLATHWLPNLLFFIIFMVFAASFFGAFEIELPAWMANSSDQKSNKKGLGGIFFMALTLVLVSFSCTGPIVGSVLIKSTQGEFWTPMVTMLAFSVAFALPFTLLAFFPSLLTKLKSGSWLSSVKVVLGFIEVAFGFKFLSVADQTYHWGLLDREVYLAIWIVVFAMLGFYLLGKLRFKNDEPVEKISLTRLILAIADFAFVVYMIPGMWGAPLKALSGYLPPIETQDFVVWNHADAIPSTQAASNAEPALDFKSEDDLAKKFNLKLPLGLQGYFTLEDGLAAAKDQNKPVFVDITGHGCVNCREMEQRVWSDPRVLDILRNEYVIVALYTDDKGKLDEKDWVTTESGKVLKDFGRVNSYIARTRFGVNAQPNYALLDVNGNQMVPIRGYNLSVEGFIDFLNSGLEKFHGR